MKVRIKKLHPAATIPTYGTTGAACFDLYALDVNGYEHLGRHVDEYEPALCRTGLAFEVPASHVMMVYSRSGHGFKSDTRLANCVGVIDSDYRGELMVKLTYDGAEDGPFIEPGDRIAQAMIIPVEQVQFELADELSNTARGAGGLGSTGA